MKRTSISRALAVAVVLLGGTTARADLISWGYQWFASPGPLSAGTGSVTLIPESYHTAQGDTGIVAVNLNTHSKAGVLTPDTFSASGGKYTLGVTLTDLDSGATATLLFKGQ